MPDAPSPMPTQPIPAAPGTVSVRMDAVAWTMLLTLSVLWGGSFIFVEVILTELPVLTVVAARVSLAAAALWFVTLALRVPLPKSAGIWRSLMFLGVINNVIPFSLIVWGQTEVTAGLAAILNATTPLFTALVAAVALSDEKLTAPKLVGILLGIGGVAAMIGPDALGRGDAPLLHQLAILGAALSYAVSAVFARRFARLGVPLLVMAAVQTTGASLVLLPIAAWVDGPLIVFGASGPVWLAIVLNAVLSTSAAYLLYFGVIKRAGATNGALVTVLVPVVAIMGGVLFLGEALAFGQLLGMAMIAAGLAVIDGRVLSLGAGRTRSDGAKG